MELTIRVKILDKAVCDFLHAKERHETICFLLFSQLWVNNAAARILEGNSQERLKLNSN